MQILLAEDNSGDVMLLARCFEKQAKSVNLCHLDNGQTALDYLYQRGIYAECPKPDLILLDLGLPVISGYDVLREIKKSSELANIPVIVLTTSENQHDEITCTNYGAERFRSKPMNLAGYEAMVQEMLAKDFPQLVKNAA